MAACDPVSFSGITPSVFETLKGELARKGFSIEGTSGVINGPFGISIQYSWDEATQTLHTEVLEKSFFVSCGQIYSQLSETIDKFTA
ncbi:MULTISPECIES: hypothetical protein [Xanthocytophaga]|uniref:Uncharacterized protein n=2 Tax=Xanthocytophaga TaxID=3078918 RepID=A0AAE3QTM2_9BACT|nr:MULTISPECIES: hypothetical protein [Xanthocytophaga]MDJ1471561.1 hypothetical protein [Xanthocytophaga flavus]MDJ1485220.1 hypothetical protein [Xanthocytophaga flavus]MDJ1504936.1 hypothetical protein [Xanthocytophaga agilis]